MRARPHGGLFPWLQDYLKADAKCGFLRLWYASEVNDDLSFPGLEAPVHRASTAKPSSKTPEKTIHFVSLGCSKNRVDTEIMLGVSDEAGFRLTAHPEEAEVIVVNTCGFIDAAKEESINTVLSLAAHKQGRCESLVMAGCLSQRYGDELAAQMPEVDHFLGSSDMLALGKVLEKNAARLMVGNPADYVMRASDPRRVSLRPHSPYLKIAEGCNRSCSFCAIPAIRGKQRSRSVDDLVREAEHLVAQGAVELNVVSQDTVSYGRDIRARASGPSMSLEGLARDRETLADLLEALGEVRGLQWIRVHYLYPESLDARLLTLFAEHPKVLPYIDMPLQHVSDAMLRRMRRGHGGERVLRTIDRLRKAVPDLRFRTTLIVGHPGEDEEDFAALCRFVEEQAFDHLGVFAYSDEEGTLSYDQAALSREQAGLMERGSVEDVRGEGTSDMSDASRALWEKYGSCLPVAAGVAKKRQRKLLSLQRALSRKRLRAMRGATITVLVDGESDESDMLCDGRTWWQAPEVDGKVILACGPDGYEAMPARGTFHQAIVTDAGDHDLVATLTGPALDVSPNASSAALSHGSVHGSSDGLRAGTRTTRKEGLGSSRILTDAGSSALASAESLVRGGRASGRSASGRGRVHLKTLKTP